MLLTGGEKKGEKGEGEGRTASPRGMALVTPQKVDCLGPGREGVSATSPYILMVKNPNVGVSKSKMPRKTETLFFLTEHSVVSSVQHGPN